MEIREIFDTIESDPCMDKDLQKDILEKIENIAKADLLVDGLEEKIEQHKDELSEKELKLLCKSPWINFLMLLDKNVPWEMFPGILNDWN